ncbi:MAG: hypothetical protein F4091_05640 [Acidimicrobiales bacterium]|nr:hypothetical protein [Acidimicrobiales bacterium]MYD84397.1 hypothetical protein [Acidimicrobiales bacterium]MYJ64937.1 hypothetical protein [Acidimicrobiales bacterium]
MSYDELRRQCYRDGIGPLFWELLLAVCGRVARRYPPATFNNSEDWSEESLRDLAQEVTLQRLLAENQLEYVLDLATDEDSLARLLAFQVRRVLAHRRSTTVVDRLLRRIDEELEGDAFEVDQLGSDRFAQIRGIARDPRAMSDAEIRQAVALIRHIPRIPSNPSGVRESKVYSAEDLRLLLGQLFDEFGGILVSDLRRILESALTAWLPTVLRESEDHYRSESTPEFELNRAAMPPLIDNVIAQLGAAHRVILLGKSQNISDGELARRMGRSRPWVADRKSEVLAMVERQLVAELPEELHGEATRALLEELARLDDGLD